MRLLYITTSSLVATAILVLASFTDVRAQPIAHSTHNPKHGGQFFLAAADTRHIEGVWPQQRVFKLYVYDEASRPLPLSRMREVQGAVTAGGQTVPLVLAGDGSALLARVPPLPMPAVMTLQLRLSASSEPEGFYFSFFEYTDENAPSFDPGPTVIPATRAGIVSALRADAHEADRLIAAADTAFVFAPAVRGRDHALALEPYVPQLAVDRRAAAEAAIQDVVRTAWLLHIAGDDGTNEQAGRAAIAFRTAIDELVTAFGQRRP
jgi:hypothetical protein